jgi:L-threonylcarbamoyladenylate synthase
VLRPGMITARDIARVTSSASDAAETPEPLGSAEAPRSPGMLGKHYSPRGRVILVPATELDAAAERARHDIAAGRRVGAMVFSSLNVEGLLEHTMDADVGGYARRLYATLHALDRAGCDLILVEEPPRTAEWRGVVDRLQRAALA